MQVNQHILVDRFSGTVDYLEEGSIAILILLPVDREPNSDTNPQVGARTKVSSSALMRFS